MQKQAVFTVRLVVDDETTLAEAEQYVTDALENAELMAHIQAERIEEVEEEEEE